MSLWLILLMALAAFPASAFPYYMYVPSAAGVWHCAEVTPAGGFIRWVDDRYCITVGSQGERR